MKSGGSTVETTIGPLEVATPDWPDGQVVLSIRPEAIEVGDNGLNSVGAQILSCSYSGLATTYHAEVNGIQLRVVMPPHRRLQPGESVVLHLPVDSLFLLPAD